MAGPLCKYGPNLLVDRCCGPTQEHVCLGICVSSRAETCRWSPVPTHVCLVLQGTGATMGLTK